MASSYLTYLIPFLFLFSSPRSLAQQMSPDPTFDCTNPNFRVIYTACVAHDYSRCCAIGTSCCAGGCCDLTHNCLNVGTSNEVCCAADDATSCGYGGSGTSPPYAVQSVACTGSDGLSSYYCPPGATCDSDEDSCVGGTSGGGGGGGGSVAPVSSTAIVVSSAPPVVSSAAPVTSSAPAVMSSAPVPIPSSSFGDFSPSEPAVVTVTAPAPASATQSSLGGLSSLEAPTVTVELPLTSEGTTPTSSNDLSPATVTVTPSSSGQKSAATASNGVFENVANKIVGVWLVGQLFVGGML